jgi:hypothetical protein
MLPVVAVRFLSTLRGMTGRLFATDFLERCTAMMFFFRLRISRSAATSSGVSVLSSPISIPYTLTTMKCQFASRYPRMTATSSGVSAFTSPISLPYTSTTKCQFLSRYPRNDTNLLRRERVVVTHLHALQHQAVSSSIPFISTTTNVSGQLPP